MKVLNHITGDHLRAKTDTLQRVNNEEAIFEAIIAFYTKLKFFMWWLSSDWCKQLGSFFLFFFAKLFFCVSFREALNEVVIFHCSIQSRWIIVPIFIADSSSSLNKFGQWREVNWYVSMNSYNRLISKVFNGLTFVENNRKIVLEKRNYFLQ